MFTAFTQQTLSPPSINAEVVCWWDANTGITLNSSGEVEVWADKGGNKYFANAPSGREPFLSQSIDDINGYNAVSFYRTGTATSNPYLQIQSGSGYIAGADYPWVEPFEDNSRTIIMVGRTTRIVNGTWGAWLTQGDNGRQSVSVNFQQYPDDYINFATDCYANGGFKASSPDYDNGTFYTAVWSWDDWDASQATPDVNGYLRVNGVDKGISSWGSSPALPTRSNPRMSLFIDAGNDSAYASYDVAEIIVYRGSLPTGSVALVEDYLQNKYGHY